MEFLVIVLIIGEIGVTIHEGKEQAKLTTGQTQILQNLRSSTADTARSIASQLTLQYEVFVNVQYDGKRGLSLFNNSKNEITFHGIKVGTDPPESNPGGPVPIAGTMMRTISLEQFYPSLFNNLPKTGSVALPITLYLKSADHQEYIAEGTFSFLRKGHDVAVSGESVLRSSKWSTSVTFSRAPEYSGACE